MALEKRHTCIRRISSIPFRLPRQSPQGNEGEASPGLPIRVSRFRRGLPGQTGGPGLGASPAAFGGTGAFERCRRRYLPILGMQQAVFLVPFGRESYNKTNVQGLEFRGSGQVVVTVSAREANRTGFAMQAMVRPCFPAKKLVATAVFLRGSAIPAAS